MNCSDLVESWGTTWFAICFEDDLNNVGRACDVKLYLGRSSLLLIRTSLDVDVEHGIMASVII